MNFFWVVLKRELLIRYRQRADVIQPLLFFVMVVVLFPLGISPNPLILREIAPGIVWVAVLLANLLSYDLLFANDFHDGSLEHCFLSGMPQLPFLLAKVLVHWLSTSLPLILISPILAYACSLDAFGTWVLMLSLLIATPILSLIGAVVAALLVNMARAGLLLALLAIPLYIPILIFATSCVIRAEQGLIFVPLFEILLAILLTVLVLSPWTMRAAIRLNLSA